jgi:putative cardiolipin synthase
VPSTDDNALTRPAHLLLTLLLTAIISGCAAQRFQQAPRPEPEFALPTQPADYLAPIESAFAAQHGAGFSGFELLDTNEDGLRWRLALLDSARRSIDAQYYLWYGDATGLLLMEHLLAAADRGVRVRLLVDDLNLMLRDAGTVGLRDQAAALLDSHPNIELRVFNPWSKRGLASRAGEMLTDMRRLNQRMHHKMLVVDNRAAILGGRNIGDEYLGLNEDFNFHDLDVLGIGPVARQASGVFDTFWNSEWVLPASALDIEATPAAAARARSELQAGLRMMKPLERFPVEPQDWTREFGVLRERLHAGTSEILTDVPRAGEIAQDMIAAVRELMASAQRELLIINAYIIPYDTGIKILRELTDGGVQVRILTNSLASHDVPAVNSHYKQRRGDLLSAGVELHEMRHDAAIQAEVADTPPVSARFMGLHSKAMVVDRRRSYIGSMNFDPRSAVINTEMGAVIDSPELGEELARLIERDMRPENSWQVQLTEAGKLQWVSSDAIVTRQPARNCWQRVEDVFFMMFPAYLY